MQYSHFTTKAQAEAAVSEKRAQGMRAYWLEYRADWFEVRSWA